MKIIILMLCFILSGELLCFGQNQTKEKETTSLGLKDKNLKLLLYELNASLKIFLLKNPWPSTESFCPINSTYSYLNPKDSIIIVLKSGTSWELLGETPKVPLFFFLNRDSKRVNDGLSYLSFKDECESRNSIAYELIERFYVYRDFRNNQNIKCLQLRYNIEPDSVGKLKVINIEVVE